MTQALIPLVVALIALAGVGFTAIVTWSISQRRIAADHITAERAKWRDRIRVQALLVHDAILSNDAIALSRLRDEFRALLNPFDPEDRKILNGIKVVEPTKVREEEAERFARQISLLLKHDWDRAKLEAGFFLGRWTLTVKRWGLDWTCGKRGERREQNGLRWYEKYKVRPVRTPVLIVLVGLGFLILLAGAQWAAGGCERLDEGRAVFGRTGELGTDTWRSNLFRRDMALI